MQENTRNIKANTDTIQINNNMKLIKPVNASATEDYGVHSSRLYKVMNED